MSAATSPSFQAVLEGLRGAVGAAGVATDEATRVSYGRDLWPLLTLALKDGQVKDLPLAVVRPGSEAEVERVVALARESGTPVVPYGGGSGVCGGAVPVAGGISLDLKRLQKVLSVDAARGLAEVEAGIVGQTLEEDLNARGLTLGHFPSSIYCSTLGGFVAARSAGQFSSRYGKIEDMVAGLRVVTPALGTIETGLYLGASRGPDWTQVFVGSEGTLGVVTRALLRVHPLPQAMRFRGFAFPGMDVAIHAMRKLVQRGLRPTVLRLYDPLDTFMAQRGPAKKPEAADDPVGVAFARRLGLAERQGDDAESYGSEPVGGAKDRLGDLLDKLPSARGLKDALSSRLRPENLPLGSLLRQPKLVNTVTSLLGNRCLMVVGYEGDADGVDASIEETLVAWRSEKGVDLGADPGERWFRTRYHVSFKLPKALEKGAWVDTIEVATFWDRLLPLYQEVKRAVGDKAVVMAHLSHAYPEGCSIYFTVAGAASGDVEGHYRRVWDAALDATMRIGGTVTHHHGVGLLKRDWAAREVGPARDLYDAAKAALDPRGILNPGKLFPPKAA